MAYLRNLQTNKKLYLHAHHTFGRRREAVDTCISKAEISKIHAAIEWTGQHWQIRDLGRNGTWLDRQKLPTAKNTQLQLGQVINFANQPQNNWGIENLDAPCNLLLGLNAESPTETLTVYHLLPDSTNPLAVLSFCSLRGQWHLQTAVGNEELDDLERPIPTNGIVEFSHYQWQLFVCTQQEQTVNLMYEQAHAEDCEFHFEVSLDEETTQLSMIYQREKIDLGERSHHYLLLHLARLKAEHAKQGLDAASQGWINNEQLTRELGINISYINIQILRARKQLANAFPGMSGMVDLLQRRRGSIRFNCPQMQISKGGYIAALEA